MSLLNDLLQKLLFLPTQASTYAVKVDFLHYQVFLVTMAAFLIIAVGAAILMTKYRARRVEASTPYVTPSHRFELMVVVLPLIIFMGWGIWGFRDFIWVQTVPKDAMDVYVTGKKWMWHFAYPDGPNSNAVLTVPAHRPVRLLLTSRDVIHSFFVPEFRVKKDAVPGRYTETWFEATKPGKYRIYCTEYCGTWHSQMIGEVIVLEPVAFDQWMAQQRLGLAGRVDVSSSSDPNAEDFKGNLVSYGRRVAGVQGCLKCHSIDGEPHIGPTWVDLYRRTTLLASGDTIVADEGYLTESMMDPYAKVVKGYAQVMPSYRGKLSAPEAAALVEFIKSLRTTNLENTPSKEPVYGPVQRR